MIGILDDLERDFQRFLKRGEMTEKTDMVCVVHNEVYISPNQTYQMSREYKTKTPSGNPVNGRWVLRNDRGNYIDCDANRNDLAERNNLKLIEGGFWEEWMGVEWFRDEVK